MRLFHAFPRRRDEVADASNASAADSYNNKGLDILRFILSHGLMCTPEDFDLYPNHHTTNPIKRSLLNAGERHDRITASRGCFTLVHAMDLSKEYQIESKEKPRYAAHSDLFGEFAIGIDPLEARSFGVLPTVYYYKHDLIDETATVAGLGSQIVERLDEIRNVFAVLSYIEGRAHQYQPPNDTFPSPEVLAKRKISVKHQPDIEAMLNTLNPTAAGYIFELFNTDRVSAWNLYDFLNIILSLYQTTDSTKENAPLAFFQQREWRLVHHKTMGLKWLGLGNHEPARNPRAVKYPEQIESLRHAVRTGRTWENEEHLQAFLQNCWVFSGTKDRQFRDFVREIVVPESVIGEAQKIIDDTEFNGDPPTITTLPQKWRISTADGIPNVVSSTIQ